MPKITVRTENGDIVIGCAAGQSLREALNATVLRVRSACRGSGACGLCRVRIEAGNNGEPTLVEKLQLDEYLLDARIRLACQIHPESDLTIHIVNPAPPSVWHTLPGSDYCSSYATAPSVAERLNYGVAVDLGTTHISLAFCHLQSGRRLAMRTGPNPQAGFGSDILNRLMAATDSSANASELQALVVNAIGEALLDMATGEGLSLNEVGQLSIVGNSAMLTLLCGDDACPLLDPKTWAAPVHCTPDDLAPWREAWNLAETAQIEVVQPLAGFVGSDLAVGLVHACIAGRPEPVLFIDFGTNSEMALWDGQRFLVTSASGGPAFEGMGISCGMAAEAGAISRIERSPHHGADWHFEVIGSTKPEGICGSGLVDLVALLREDGTLTEEGLFSSSGQTVFLLPGCPLRLTKHDVDQLQRAKGAIATGFELLCAEAGIATDRIAEVLIGGAFGRTLNAVNAIAIGLLPPVAATCVCLLGNTALNGCQDLVVSPEACKGLGALRMLCTVINLSSRPQFEDAFLEHLYLRSCRVTDDKTSLPAATGWIKESGSCALTPAFCFSAFVRSVQYIAGLLTNADLAQEIISVATKIFCADAASLYRIEGDHPVRGPSSNAGIFAALADEIENSVQQVFDSGFLSLEQFSIEPAMASVAFLPVTRDASVVAVLVVAYAAEDTLPKELLNALLGVASLLASTLARQEALAEMALNNEQLEAEISERKRVEENLLVTSSVFDNTQEAVLITDANNAIIDANPAFTRITGYSREEVIGKNPKLLNSGRQDNLFYATMWQSLKQDKAWRGEIWNRRKSGETYPELLSISSICDNDGKVIRYVAVFSDISSIKAHEAELSHAANYDALTGIPNRVLLADRLKQAIAKASREQNMMAVCYLDLDGFKPINDSMGHEAGDLVLIEVAKRIENTTRGGDTVARLGGDEFVALLQGLDKGEECAAMLERLLTAIAHPFTINNKSFVISASIGVSIYPLDDEDPDTLLRHADQAMYAAKQSGKNRFLIYDPALDRFARDQHEKLERIRRALARREFVLFYQPKVNMRTGAIIGAEALIRWQHPERGLLPPAEFLPVIEDHPLAIEVGEWVIDTALAQMEQWQAGGLNIPVSVNVGALQLQQENFVERLQEIITAHPEILPGSLEVEVLETTALADLVKISKVIDNCRKIGVMFALDDFGTGYSSLTYLKRLPVTLLKIDQSFVRDMLDDPDDMAILEGVLGLGIAFRRHVIAEGVETAEHGTLLLQLGCELGQGYGISRPIPAQQLPLWTTTWQPNPAWADLQPVSRDDLPLLFASVEHRAWIAAFKSYLKGECETVPPLDHRQCRFGTWLEDEGQARHGIQPTFQAIAQLHLHVHVLATELQGLNASGQNFEALARLDELDYLKDSLLKQLEMLVQKNRQLAK